MKTLHFTFERSAVVIRRATDNGWPVAARSQ